MNSKTLPSLRINEKTSLNILKAIERFNERNILKLNLSEFRRLSYEFLSQLILQNKENQFKEMLRL